MKRREIIDEVKKLGLPQGSYVVFGAAPMAIAGLREANDIDFLVTPEVLDQLRQRGWKQIDKGPKDKPYEFEAFEAHANWDFSTYAPSLEHLLKTATIVDGVPFAHLYEVRKWKSAWGRPKDLADIELIDTYLSSQ